MTPGDTCSRQDRHFDGYRYSAKIAHCRRKVSRGLKTEIYRAYNIPEKCRRRYTIDHFYPLSIGGNNSIKNLWPEHKLLKETRLYLEQDVFDNLVQGKITQEEAFRQIHEAKMNPPPQHLQWLETYGTECDRAAVQMYRNSQF